MADTSIEWTQRSWNPIVGCSLATPGCTNCYAMAMAARLDRMGVPHYAGLTKEAKAGAVWTGKLALAPEHVLLEPLRRRKPTTWFVNSMGDLFHESVPDEWIDRVFAVMALCPQHTFQVLTKRAARMRAYLSRHRWHIWAAVGRAIDSYRWGNLPPVMGSDCTPLPNVWLGVSAEDQRRADERVPDLLATSAAIRFVSAEPLLGPIDFKRVGPGQKLRGAVRCENVLSALDGVVWDRLMRVKEETLFRGLDWIIVGGESGPKARPMHPDWARSIRDQCAATGTAFFFKQWGEWYPQIDRDRDDPDWRQDYSYLFADRGKHSWLNLAGGRGFHGEAFHIMGRVGKKAAGRLLDGVEHNAMPRATP